MTDDDDDERRKPPRRRRDPLPILVGSQAAVVVRQAATHLGAALLALQASTRAQSRALMILVELEKAGLVVSPDLDQANAEMVREQRSATDSLALVIQTINRLIGEGPALRAVSVEPGDPEAEDPPRD